MAADHVPAAAEAVANKEKPPQTLSQFVARVLDQLALSAWLPSAALVLLLDLVVQLGAVLDAKGTGPAGAIGRALSQMSATGIGGGVLLATAVVVLTVLTQAFTFEAIRILEGYWGTARIVEWVAHRRTRAHRRRIEKLSQRERGLTSQAWTPAKARIIEIQAEFRRNGRRAELTPAMIGRLEAMVLHTLPSGRLMRLTPSQQERLSTYNWEPLAPAEPLRRRVNVAKRLRDYPEPERALPTRLGNILRAHEDQLDAEDLDEVESYVQRIFGNLPPSLQEDHDNQRNRLDLYCTMVFVVAVSGLAAAAGFAPRHWPYAAGAAGVMVIGMWLMYRAALATARAYGQLLVTSVGVAEPWSSAGPDAAGTDQAAAQAAP